MLILQLAHDIIHVKLENLPSMGSSNTPQLTTAIVGLLSAIIGGVITIWYKRKELKNISDNLLLQKQLFEETKARNENEIKAELIRLQNLSNQYKLSLAKFDFEHLEKILEYGNDKDEKVAMLKDLAKQLDDFNPEIPDWVEDYEDYEEIVIDHTFYRLTDINKSLNDLTMKHVTAFSSLHDEVNKVANEAAYLKRQVVQFNMEIPDVEDEYVIEKLSSSLFQLYQDYNGLLNLMKSEFKDLDRMKREFIREQAKKSSKSDKAE